MISIRRFGRLGVGSNRRHYDKGLHRTFLYILTYILWSNTKNIYTEKRHQKSALESFVFFSVVINQLVSYCTNDFGLVWVYTIRICLVWLVAVQNVYGLVVFGKVSMRFGLVYKTPAYTINFGTSEKSKTHFRCCFDDFLFKLFRFLENASVYLFIHFL